jgi:hypothetical protein
MSEWQLAQVLVLWTEAANFWTSTNNETALPAAFVIVRVRSPWHSIQEVLLIAFPDAASAPPKKPAFTNIINPA